MEINGKLSFIKARLQIPVHNFANPLKTFESPASTHYTFAIPMGNNE